MTSLKEISQDSRWQKFRDMLLGNWKEDPEGCCFYLKKYLGFTSNSTVDELRIVNNYLNSAPFVSGQISHECITNLKEEITLEITTRKNNCTWK